jgi:hypothetical protein
MNFMGEAKRRRMAADARKAELALAVGRVGSALRRLATAASGQFGSDCYVHAALGHQLLADLGIEARIEVGEAAWRVGSGDGDVIAHTPRVQGFAPENMPPDKQALAYHAWLVVDGNIVDFTTYQFERKARELDAADGGHTTVTWRPEALILPVGLVLSYRQVAQAPKPGVAFYDAHPDLLQLMAAQFELQAADLAVARLLLTNPEMNVFGPNDVRDAGEP